MKTSNLLRASLLGLLGLGISIPQAAAADSIAVAPQSNFLAYTLMAMGSAIFVGGLFALWSLYTAVMDTAKVRLLQELGIEGLEHAGLAAPQASWWKRQYKRWTNVVPVEKEVDIMLDHDYDGIRELDNSLPPWWVAMFYITIGLGVMYIGYFHFSDYGKTMSEQYEIEIEEAENAIKAYLATQADAVDETNAEMIDDEQQLALGETMFISKCATCHGNEGQGGVGPNLADAYWLHGGSIKDIFKTIKHGIPEKGMIAWKSQLRPADIHRISAFIVTLQGTNPPNAKESQGELYQVENMTPDSVVTNEVIGLLEQ